METQVEKVRLPFPPGMELGPDCLCPPVCFQCPPPFCLPCGPGPGSREPADNGNIPAPRQCGPFIMLNTPTERKTIILPLYGDKGKRLKKDAGDEYKNGDCCVKQHHHHHIAEDGEQDCCEKSHHHHHHPGEMEECKKYCAKKGLGGSNETKNADCCVKQHHHHHAKEDGEMDCCEKFHHHHHHQADDDKCEKKVKTPESCGQRQRRPGRANLHSMGRSNSRELRASKLLIGCDCEKRNGLQDDCQRSLCQGSEECKTVPPTCVPSAYSNGKHLIARMDKALAKIMAAKKQNAKLGLT